MSPWAPLGKAWVADHCDHWHTSLGRLIKVLAVLCHWINAWMGTLDGFLISGQLDNENAVGGQRLKSAWTSFSRIPAGLWAILLGQWIDEKDVLLPFSVCNKVQWSANAALGHCFTTTTSTTITANLVQRFFLPPHLSHKANCPVAIICSPQAQQGSQVVGEADV